MTDSFEEAADDEAAIDRFDFQWLDPERDTDVDTYGLQFDDPPGYADDDGDESPYRLDSPPEPPRPPVIDPFADT